MLSIIQVMVYWFVLPVIFILILLFDLNLVRTSDSREQRFRMLLGVIGGFILAVIVMLLDQSTNIFRDWPLPDPNRIDQVWPFVVIAFLAGVLLLFVIHQLLRAQVVLSFIVMFTVIAIIVAVYFLLTISEIRSVVAVSALGFLAGLIIYLMLQPSLIPLLVAGISSDTDKPNKPSW